MTRSSEVKTDESGFLGSVCLSYSTASTLSHSTVSTQTPPELSLPQDDLLMGKKKGGAFDLTLRGEKFSFCSLGRKYKCRFFFFLFYLFFLFPQRVHICQKAMSALPVRFIHLLVHILPLSLVWCSIITPAVRSEVWHMVQEDFLTPHSAHLGLLEVSSFSFYVPLDFTSCSFIYFLLLIWEFS